MTDAVDQRAERTHRKIAESAAVTRASEVKQADSADRRTQLAADRTALAAERTYAAWVRTGLAALASGIGARALLEKVVVDWLTVATGCLLVLFSAFCFLAAVWRELFPRITPEHEVRRMPSPLLISVNGFLILVSLAAFAGLLASS
ncbi:MAG: YidH family protein [Sphingomonas sp.]